MLPPRWAGLLLCGSLALSLAGAQAADVSVGPNGLVSVAADDEPLQAVIEALAEATGLRLVQEVAFERRVTARLEARPLSEVLENLLNHGDSFQLFIAAADDGGTVPATLWVFEEGEGDQLVTAFAETALLRGGVADRKAAVRTLADIGTADAVAALAVGFADEDVRVRRAVAEALAGIGSDDALAVLASGMAADDAVTRVEAALSIGEAGGASAGPYLDLALANDDARIRSAAVTALGDMPDADSRHRLRGALSDPDPDVRERALYLIEDLDDEAMFRTLFPAE